MSLDQVEDPQYQRFLVVGSGIAGLQFALLSAQYGSVGIVTKKDSQESNTNYAQGGIAAVLSPLDNFDLHIQDTLIAGAGLCRHNVVSEMVHTAPTLIDRLLTYGVEFSKSQKNSEANCRFELGREGGHSRRRILHAKDLTGRELETCLLENCRNNPNITLDENHIGLDLITGHDLGYQDADASRIVGCWVLDRKRLSRRPYLADTVIMATGGCGKVYSYTSNPDIATGDGMAMAFRAGAELANLEFVQFHPTCLYHSEAKSFLISEAVRGEGAVLINKRGEQFMTRYHTLADLAPRDVVARSIDHELKNSGDNSVFLDLRHLDCQAIKKRFPHLDATCARFGIDMTGEPVPVVPAAHYMCGGVKVDLSGRTSLPGLYVIGESACTGIHGANRLASNSLLEAVFMASTAAAVATEDRKYFGPDRPPVPPNDPAPTAHTSGQEVIVLEHDWDSVRRIMWDYVGIVRSKQRLNIALHRLWSIRSTVEQLYTNALINPDLVELRNIALMGELIVLCALNRKESRGLHYTLDYPSSCADKPVDTVIKRGQRIGDHIPLEPEQGTK